MAITGKTKLLGVMGWPVEHSLSPPMHAAAIEAAGLDYAYVPFPVHPDRVGEAVQGLRALGFRGCNVTIPHKPAVIPHLDEVRSAARGIGAVNTIIIEPDGRLIGDNTDANGAFDALEEETGVTPEDHTILILGAGGAARGVAWGAAARGAGRILLLNRTRSRAEDLAREFAPLHPATRFEAVSSADELDLESVRIVLQMTRLGMEPGDPLPLDPKGLRGDAVVLEAVYAPLVTPFMEACRARGLRVVDGLEMLVAQGASSFEMWTGVKPIRHAMRRAIQPR